MGYKFSEILQKSLKNVYTKKFFHWKFVSLDPIELQKNKETLRIEK